MTSMGLAEGVLKLGRTTDDPLVRAKQLSTSTSSPMPFVVAYSKAVADCEAAEAELHEIFADQRLNTSREYFKVPLYRVIVEMDRLAAAKPVLDVDLSFSELFASFPDDGSPRALTPEEQAKCRALEARR